MSNHEDSKSNDILQWPEDREAKCEYGGVIVVKGLTSVVERMPNGDIIKTPWLDTAESDTYCKQLAIEAKVYQRLGEHPRLVKFKDWNPDKHALTLEYMPYGNMEAYVKRLRSECSVFKRGFFNSAFECFSWMDQMAEALSLLHSKGVIHCDVAPRNFLLGADRNIRIADFGGSSIDGSKALVCVNRRYRLPCSSWEEMATVKGDLFALGSVIYFLIEGKEPFEELSEAEVKTKFKAGQFPEFTDIGKASCCEEILRLCWHQEAESAEQIRKVLAEIRAEKHRWM